MLEFVASHYDECLRIEVVVYKNPLALTVWELSEIAFVCNCKRHDTYQYVGVYVLALHAMKHPEIWCPFCEVGNE